MSQMDIPFFVAFFYHNDANIRINDVNGKSRLVNKFTLVQQPVQPVQKNAWASAFIAS